MRTYFIFNINKEMSILTKDSPYMLYKSFESIYKGQRSDLNIATNLYEQLALRIHPGLNNHIYNTFKDDDFYYLANNNHQYYNKYKDERCQLTIKNSYMICLTNTIKPKILTKLDGNYFVCDFENKDYFWLNEIYCSK